MENLVLNRAFWKNRHVLITGHTGFKGAWLSLWLQDCGATVSGFALEPGTDPNLFDAAGVAEGMRSGIGDIRDLEAVRRALSENEPDIVIHLAAQSLVRESYRDPVGTYAVNVMGTVNLLEAVRQHRLAGAARTLQAVLIVTSDKCYENNEWHWSYRENDRMGGHDPYSNSKGCCELVVDAFRKSFFVAGDGGAPLGLATARAGNVVGGGDWAADRLVPDAIRAFSGGEAVSIRYPDAIRPWQHVLEPLAGYLRLCERLVEDPERYSGGWNFGPDAASDTAVRQVVDRLVARWGEGAGWVHDKADHPHEATYLKLDSSRARALLDWQPRLDLTDTINLTVDWYRAFGRAEDLRRVSIEQIRQYEHA